MARLTRLLIMTVLTVAPVSLVAARGASGVNLVNNTGQTIFNLYIRRTGTTSWQPLAATPPKPAKGLKASAKFNDPDCAFDLKVTLEDKSEPVWGGVNLCEVKSLTLNRNAAGVTWADYD
jgi:hypothetical protein